MEGSRKSCFDLLRHKNACSIDDLKLKLRKVILDLSIFSLCLVLLFLSVFQLYIKELKIKRGKILNGKREIEISEEDDLDFYKEFCKEFFGQYEDPWGADEDLLSQIWEEIRLEGLVNRNLVDLSSTLIY